MALDCNAFKNGSTPCISKSLCFEVEVIEHFTEKSSFNKAFAKGKPSQPQTGIRICSNKQVILQNKSKKLQIRAVSVKLTSLLLFQNFTKCKS